MHRGLNSACAVGRSGLYRAWVGMDTFQCATTLWRGHEFCKAGARQDPLFSPEFPSAYSFETKNQSWTGKTVSYAWKGGGLSLELRATLPGPLLHPQGNIMRLRWALRNAATHIISLDKGFTRRIGMGVRLNGSRFLLCDTRVMPTLLVSSAPLTSLDVLSHEHWTLHCTAANPRILVIPLLALSDAPHSPAQRSLWKKIISAPPLRCEESYRVEGDVLHLRQHFKEALVAPLPPLSALLGATGGLQTLPNAKRLIKTLIGPYDIVLGNTAEYTVQLGWSRTSAQPTRPVKGILAEIPEELVYAGDVSWDPATPMDRLLSLRTWAPLITCMPEKLKKKMLPLLAPPVVAAFKKSLMILKEPVTGKPWAKEASLFHENGEVTYDSDWYNGLTLSGMAAACECAEPSIAAAGRKTAFACKKERGLLTAYFEIFHDWLLGLAWIDPRGETWNLDCSHNGLEGLLAEARMCEQEGATGRRDRMLYLAGKMAIGFMAAYPCTDWCRTTEFVEHDPGGPHTGLSAIFEGRGAHVDALAGKATYSLAGHFPAFSRLIQRHGPLKLWQTAAGLWEKKYASRYKNWIFHYTGKRKPTVKGAKKSLTQEARVQAAVFYYLAPEVCLRLWTLGQDPDRVEKLFKQRLNLAEQLLCRAGFSLF